MAHCNTVFHQMLKLIPRHDFSKLEAEYGTGRKARSFTRWSQLVHLISMQLTARASLRDGIASLKSRLKNLYYLGVKPVVRSTFADANNKRPASFLRRCLPRCTDVASRWPRSTSLSSKTSSTAWTPLW